MILQHSPVTRRKDTDINIISQEKVLFLISWLKNPSFSLCRSGYYAHLCIVQHTYPMNAGREACIYTVQAFFMSVHITYNHFNMASVYPRVEH